MLTATLTERGETLHEDRFFLNDTHSIGFSIAPDDCQRMVMIECAVDECRRKRGLGGFTYLCSQILHIWYMPRVVWQSTSVVLLESRIGFWTIMKSFRSVGFGHFRWQF